MKQPPKKAPVKVFNRSSFSFVFLLALGLIAFKLFGPEASASHVFAAANEPSMNTPIGGISALVIILGVLCLNGLYTGAEMALEVLRPMHIKHVKESSSVRAERLQDLIDRKSRFVGACIFASHVCRFTLVLAGLLLVEGVAPYTQNSFFLAAITVSIPVLLLNLVFEMVPKSYAALHPHRVSLALYRFIQISAGFFIIPASLVSGLANLVTARFGAKASFSIANQAEEEIKTLVESAEETGEIESDERELLHSVFEFTDTVAREVMTPRVDLDAMPVKSNPDDVLKVIEETGHSRIPLYEETDDQIVGIIHAKDLLMAMLKGPKPVVLRKLMRPPLFVPENKSLHELLTEMRLARNQLAIVQDEFGGTSGIVSIEDIVEELVGEIVDEYDDDNLSIEALADGWLIDGKTHVDDVDQAIGANFESQEFDTIGGLVFGLFGRQPKLGETMESEGYRFTISETDGRRILRLKIEPCTMPTDLEALDA
jgi:putative hemolysin